MAQPTPYEREFNFSNQQAATPTTPIPAPHLDAELNRVKLTLDQTLANLALIQSDEGLIAENIVGYDQLTEEVRDDLLNGTATIGTFEAALDSVFADAAEAGDGVDTVVGLKSGSIVKTPLPFITPEMHGAVGDDFSHPLSERYANLAAAQVDYPFATSLTNEIDWCAWTKAIAAARVSNTRIVGAGKYYADQTIRDDATGEEYWDGSTQHRPIDVFMNKLTTTSIDVGIYLKGRGAIYSKWVINDISGPGKNVADLGTPNQAGTGERIGILIEAFVDLEVRSIFGFNKGICGQECFCTFIKYGWQWDCHTGFELRPHPDSGMRNQVVYVDTVSIGGIFTGPGGPGDVFRRGKSSKIGVKLRGVADCILKLQIGYVQVDSTSTFIDADSTCFSNVYHLYLEGVREDGEFGTIGDVNSHVYLGGMGTPNDVKEGTLRINGHGTKVYNLMDRGGNAARSFRVAELSSIVLEIDEANEVVGANKTQSLKPVSSLNHCLVSSTLAWTFAGSGSATLVTDGPDRFEAEQVYEITAAGADGVRLTSDVISISGETSGRKKIRVVGAVRGVTNRAKVAYYIVNSTTNVVIGKGTTTGLKSTSGWTLLEFIDEIPAGVTGIRIDMAVRNGSSFGETGCVVRMRKPLAYFNVEARDNIRLALPLDTTDTVKGRILPGFTRSVRPIKYDKTDAATLASTAIATGGMAIYRLTAVGGGGTTVNGITGLQEQSPCWIINESGSNLTIADAAGEWSADFTLNTGAAMQVVMVNSKIYKVT